MFDLIGTVLTGGATGVIGSVIGKAFSFLDAWQEEKKADKDHGRTIEMLRLQNEIGAEENEREMAVAEANADANMRMASYSHDSMAGPSSVWVANLLRLVRPCLTLSLRSFIFLGRSKWSCYNRSICNLYVLKFRAMVVWGPCFKI